MRAPACMALWVVALALGLFGCGTAPRRAPTQQEIALANGLVTTDEKARMNELQAYFHTPGISKEAVMQLLIARFHERDRRRHLELAELFKWLNAAEPGIGEAAPYLLRDMRAGDDRLRRAAAEGCACAVAANQRLLPQLLPYLADRDPVVRDAAIKAFGYAYYYPSAEKPPLAPEGARAIAQVLSERGNGVPARVNAAIALGQIGKDGAPEAVPVLIQALRDPEHLVRFNAAQALTPMELDDRWLSLLEPIYKENQPGTEALVLALAAIGRPAIPLLVGELPPGGKRRLDAIIQLESQLEDMKLPKLRAGATLALGSLGPDSRFAVPLLQKVLARDPDLVVRGNARESLAALGSAPAISQRLLTPNWRVHNEALRDLATLSHEEQARIVLQMMPALRDGIEKDHLTALEAFRWMSRRSSIEPALPRVIEDFGDKSEEVRVSAYVVGARFLGPGDVQLVPQFLERMKRERSAPLYHLMGVLAAIHSEASIPALCRAIYDPDELVQGGAASALGAMLARGQAIACLSRAKKEGVLKGLGLMQASRALERLEKAERQQSDCGALKTQLLSPSPGAGQRTAALLHKDASRRAECSEYLAGLFQEPDPRLHIALAEFYRWGEPANPAEAAAPLVRDLDDKDPVVRQAAERTLCDRMYYERIANVAAVKGTFECPQEQAQ